MLKVMLGMAALFFFEGAAHAERTALTIVVKNRTQQALKPIAFSGVGTFEIFRNDAKFANGSCPDSSNREGKLACSIICDPKDSMSKTLRVVPPGKSLRVRGYVAPPADEIELQGCTVLPSANREFVYTDSRLALTELTRSNVALSQLVTIKASGSGVQLADTAHAIAVFKKVGGASDGVAVLGSFQRIAAALADHPQFAMDQESVKGLSQYSVGASNVLLRQIANAQIDSKTGEKVKLSGSKEDFYSNLTAIEDSLDKKVGRSAQQNLLLNDIQGMKAKPPATGMQDMLKVRPVTQY